MKRHIRKYFSVEMEKIPGVVVVHKKWASNCHKAPLINHLKRSEKWKSSSDDTCPLDFEKLRTRTQQKSKHYLKSTHSHGV